MNKEEIQSYLKKVDELELKLNDKDRETLQWLIYGYNQCAKLLHESETKINKAKELIKKHYFVKIDEVYVERYTSDNKIYDIYDVLEFGGINNEWFSIKNNNYMCNYNIDLFNRKNW